MLRQFLKSKRKTPSVLVLYEGAEADLAPSDVPVVAHLEGAAQKKQRAMRGRIGLCAMVFGVVFLSLGVRLATISLDGPGNHLSVKAPEIEGSARSEITDRKGTPLVLNKIITGLTINVANVWNKHDTALSLSIALPDVDAASLLEGMQTKRYVSVKNELTQKERESVLLLGLPGVNFTKSYKRIYPQGALAAHAVGHTTPGRGGVMGFEKTLDDMAIEDEMVISSMDITVQQILEEELAAQKEEYRAKAAWGVLMHANTGEVIAMASLPDFNPNVPGASPADFRRNRAMYDRYEFGSAFKAFTAAMVLEEGVGSLSTDYDATKPLQIADRRIADFHGKKRVLSFSEVMQYSSNIGAVLMAEDVGATMQKKYMSALGLLSALETELPETRNPDFPARWGPVEAATISYGHGIAVTPMQLTAAFAAVVNGGTKVQPTFLHADENSKKPMRRRDAVKKERVFDPSVSGKMRMVMRQVVTDGTGGNAEAHGYYIIGKTATADKPRGGRYDKDTRLSSFIGAFPGYDPEYVLLVSFDEPHPRMEISRYATSGIVAAPAFRRIVERAAPVLNIAPTQEPHAKAQFLAGLKATLPDEDEVPKVMVDGMKVAMPEDWDAVGHLLVELSP